jgi:hypothetical protein
MRRRQNRDYVAPTSSLIKTLFTRNDNEDMLYEEFKYYNNTKNLIDEEILNDIKEKLKTTEKYIFWSNEDYCKSSLIFLFYKLVVDEETQRIDYFVKLIDKTCTFTYDEIKGVKDIINGCKFIKFQLTDEQLTIIDETIKGNSYSNIPTNEFSVFNTFDEMIEYYISKKGICCVEVHWEKIKKLDTIFNIELVQPTYKDNESFPYSSTTYHIFKVIEKRINNVNYRISFTRKLYPYSSCYGIDIYDENDKSYNYIDIDSIYIWQNNTEYFLDRTLVTKGEDNSIDVDVHALEDIKNNIDRIIGKNDKKIITQAIYRFYTNNTKRRDRLKNNASEQEIKIMDQYIKILKMGKTVKIGQVLINMNSIQTEDGLFNIKFDKTFFDFEESFISLKREIDKGEAKYNFNLLYELILDQSAFKVIDRVYVKDRDYKNFTEAKFIVNNMEINVKKEGNRININGIFCRIDDTYDILSKAICFNDVKDYDRYVKDVSFIGLELKKIISSGVHIYLLNPLATMMKKLGQTMNEKTIMRFTLLWDSEKRNNVYLVLDNKKYLIKYKHKFLKYFNYPEMNLTVNDLKENLIECLENFEDELIIEIIQNATKEAKIIEEKGKLLLANTIKDTGAKEITITTTTENLTGYEVIGIRTNSKYFIEKFHLNVYRYDNGRWNRRCVVSDPNKQRIYEDRMANRLVNIFNENKRITTLFN